MTRRLRRTVDEGESIPYDARPQIETLVRAHSSEIWQLCGRLGDPEDADDLVQETFLRAHLSLPAFRGDSSARTWLFSIARRVCADHVRRATRQRALVYRLRGTRTATREIPDHAGEIHLRELIDGLPPERREAFVLTQLFGLSYEETAEICGCPVGTIRSRVARARSDLLMAHAEDSAPESGALPS